jgi:hypothetical protein
MKAKERGERTWAIFWRRGKGKNLALSDWSLFSPVVSAALSKVSQLPINLNNDTPPQVHTAIEPEQ